MAAWMKCGAEDNRRLGGSAESAPMIAQSKHCHGLSSAGIAMRRHSAWAVAPHSSHTRSVAPPQAHTSQMSDVLRAGEPPPPPSAVCRNPLPL